jgi:hypothetical protein
MFFTACEEQKFVTNIGTRKGLSNSFTILLTVLCYFCPSATSKPCANVSSISEGYKRQVIKNRWLNYILLCCLQTIAVKARSVFLLDATLP